MQCPHCHQELPEGLYACFYCGTLLSAGTAGGAVTHPVNVEEPGPPEPEIHKPPKASKPKKAGKAPKPAKEKKQKRAPVTGSTQKGRNKFIPILVVIVLVGGLCGVALALDLHENIPFLSSAKPAGVEEESQETVEAAAAQEQPSQAEEASMAEAEPEPASEAEEPEEVPEEVVPEAAVALSPHTGQWYDFAHISAEYMAVQEDGEHMYFLQVSQEPGVAGGALYRMDMESLEIESYTHIANGVETVASYALLDGMIYFSAQLEPQSLHCGYYRVPKDGGEAELLFVQERSNMLAYEGDIYFLFQNQRAMGVYTPGRDSLPRLTRLVDWEGEFINEALTPSVYFDNAFSIYDGYFYYGASYKGDDMYYRRSLRNGSEDFLLQSLSLDENIALPSIKDSTGYYVVYGNDGMYMYTSPVPGFDQDSRTLLGQLGSYEYFSFFAISNDQLVYLDDAGFVTAPLADPHNTVILAPGGYAHGIGSQWLVLSGQLVHLHERYFVSLSEATGGVVIDLVAAGQAQQLAQDSDDEWAAAYR